MLCAVIIVNSGKEKYEISSEYVVSTYEVKYESYYFIIFEFLIQLILLHDGIAAGFVRIENYGKVLNLIIVLHLHC